jgi:hypothetical protein
MSKIILTIHIEYDLDINDPEDALTRLHRFREAIMKAIPPEKVQEITQQIEVVKQMIQAAKTVDLELDNPPDELP